MSSQVQFFVPIAADIFSNPLLFKISINSELNEIFKKEGIKNLSEIIGTKS